MSHSAVLLGVPFLILCIGHALVIPSEVHQSVPSITRQTSPPTCRAALRHCLKRLDADKSCKLLPVPSRSLLPLVVPGKFLLHRLRRNVWAYNDGNYLSLIMKSSDRLALIDFPDTSNAETASGTVLTDAVEKVLAGMVPKRVDMVYSHAHFDHIGGASRFYRYAKKQYPGSKFFIWGTKETQELINASTTDRAVEPNVIIRESGRTLTLSKDLEATMTVLGGHTQQDLLIQIPRVGEQASVLYFVDGTFPRWVMPFNLAITQDVLGLIKAHKTILERKFDVLVPGHLRLGDRGDVRRNLEYLQDLVTITAEVRGSVSRERFVGAGIAKVADRGEREFGNAWWVFRLTRELEIDDCYRRMIEKWGCRLAAVDVFLRGHCLMGLMFDNVEA